MKQLKLRLRSSDRLRIWRPHIFCIECGAIMVKRVPRGTDTWEEFYGCRNWPECKYTRTILPDGRIAPEVDPFSEDPVGALSWIMEER